MSIFKFITLSQLRKVLSALETRFKKIEYDVENPPTPDWNQNDSSEKNYIANRVCYVGDSEMNHILSGQILSGEYDFIGNVNDVIGFITQNQQYRVVWDEVSYSGTISYNNSCYYIGNGYLSNTNLENTEEPFCIIIFPDGEVQAFPEETGSGLDIYFELYINMPIVHKLDDMYLNGRLIKEGLGYRSAIINNSDSPSLATGEFSVSEGDGYAKGNYSHAEGNSYASGLCQHSEGSSKALSNCQHSEGSSTASGEYQHSEALSTASGTYQHSEASSTVSGAYQHSEGLYSSASGQASHAEGGNTSNITYDNIQLTGAARATTFTVNSVTRSGSTYSGRSLIGCIISNKRVIAETMSGNNISTITLNDYLSTSSISNKKYQITFPTRASGVYSHAEGEGTESTGDGSHSEGINTFASGDGSHQENIMTKALGSYSHQEGMYAISSGEASHSEGYETIANHAYQHVFGQCNVEDPSTNAAGVRGTYVEIVGNGTASGGRSNARTLDWSGNEVLAGKLTVGAGPTSNMDVATKQYVDNTVGNINLPITYIEITRTYNAQTGTYTYTTGLTGEETIALLNANAVVAYNGKEYWASSAEPTVRYYSHINTDGYGNFIVSVFTYYTQNNTWNYNSDIMNLNITSTVTELTDTAISSPSNGEVLMYNSTTSKWENTSLPVYNGGVAR